MTDHDPIRPEAAAAPSSGIVDTVNYGRGRPGLVPLWVGEGDLATPGFIGEAATRSLAAGETFYTHQRGIPELREAIARRQGAILGKALSPERFFVTSGGMHAVQIALRMVAGPGDEVVVPTPAWPNFRGALVASGAEAVDLPLVRGEGGFSLDLAALEAALTPRTRALAAALVMFTLNLLGLGLGPLVVGALSDALSPALGQESLRYALLAVPVSFALAGLHWIIAARGLRAQARAATEKAP